MNIFSQKSRVKCTILVNTQQNMFPGKSTTSCSFLSAFNWTLSTLIKSLFDLRFKSQNHFHLNCFSKRNFWGPKGSIPSICEERSTQYGYRTKKLWYFVFKSTQFIFCSVGVWRGVWNRREMKLKRPALPYDYKCFADCICIRNFCLMCNYRVCNNLF